MLTIAHVQTDEQVGQYQELLAEYKAWDIRMVRSMGLNPDEYWSGYETNVRELLAESSLANGGLLLASSDGQLAGCAGLRRLSPGIGEMKQLYVRPAFRGRGLGKALIGAIVEAARQCGYRTLRLETATYMKDAQALYQSLGFHFIQPYRELPEALRHLGVFMELNLE